MTFDEYQQAAHATAIYPQDREREYLSLGLISEVGELAGKMKKEIRDGVDLTKAILDECGDIAWYGSQITRANGWSYQFGSVESHIKQSTDTGWVIEMAGCAVDAWWPDRMSRLLNALESVCDRRGTTLHAVCEHNIAKLQSRQQRNALGGSGDNR